MTRTDDFALSRIGQIAMTVQDVARATAFYRDVLGLPLVLEVPGPMAFFDCAGVWLMLALPGEGMDHPGSVLYFDVQEIETAHRTLEERGVEFVSEPHKVADLGDRELWMAFFKDGEWNLLALRSHVPR